MIERSQIFTPVDSVVKLLDVLEYKRNLYGKKIIENACGDGNILTIIIERYIIDCRNKGFNNIKIKKGLERDIFGVEIDGIHYKNCINNLDDLAAKYQIYNVQWNILNNDFLKMNFSSQFDYVVGNPPYITYNDLDIKTREFVKGKFEVCSKGKFDYCYAFIEASIKILKKDGKMTYLIPSSIFKNVFAHDLRLYLLPLLKEIYDYQTIKLFNVLTSSAIILCDKKYTSKNINYTNIDKGLSYKIEKKNLGDKWSFLSTSSKVGAYRFGDYFNASITVATLLNDAYILKNYKNIVEDGTEYIQAGSYLLEKSLVRKAVSPRSMSYNKKELIIFPYLYKKGVLYRYDVEEFQKKFPYGNKYLSSFYDKLNKRDSDKSAKWFEYGRNQALAHLDQEKLLVSTVITKKTKVYKLDKDTIPYSGIYITKKSELDLDFAIKILESDDFFVYANNIGINANGSSMRVTVKDINNYIFNIEEV